MTREPELRRRPIASEGREAESSWANVEERGDPKDVVSAVLSELGAQLQAFLGELRLGEIKPWGDFFARFKAPKTWDTKVLDERFTTNFLHYRGNYSLIAAILIVVGIVTHPVVLVALLSCALLVTFLFPVGDHPRIVRAWGRTLNRSERLMTVVIGVACILFLSGAWYILIFYGGLTVFLCMVHAIFRPRTISSKAGRVAAEAQMAARGFTIEGAQNFVEGVFGMNRNNSRSSQ